MRQDTAALAVYDSTRPGERNHWVLSRIAGEWGTGVVRGYVFDLTWGPADGEPGFIPDAEGHDVAVSVVLSEQLERYWREIDDFQGPGYERQNIDVTMADGSVICATIFVALTEA